MFMVLRLVEVTQIYRCTGTRQHIFVSIQTSTTWENSITCCMAACTVPGKCANTLSGLLNFNRD